MLCPFVASYKIDSYLKLRLLLSMHQHPQRSLSLDELCERFFVANQRTMQQLVTDLCQRGLLTCDGDGWRASERADVSYCLGCLQRTFDDPLARQRLLDLVAGRNPGYMS